MLSQGGGGGRDHANFYLESKACFIVRRNKLQHNLCI